MTLCLFIFDNLFCQLDFTLLSYKLFGFPKSEETSAVSHF